MFRALGLLRASGVAAFLAPTLPEVPALLFGAQVTGVASSLNYLLSRDAIVDLLAAEEGYDPCSCLRAISMRPAGRRRRACWEEGSNALLRCLSSAASGEGTGRIPGAERGNRFGAGRRSWNSSLPPTGTRCALFSTPEAPRGGRSSAVDARQPDPRRLWVRASVRLRRAGRRHQRFPVLPCRGDDDGRASPCSRPAATLSCRHPMGCGRHPSSTALASSWKAPGRNHRRRRADLYRGADK